MNNSKVPEKTITLLSDRSLNDYLILNPCECGGDWRVVSEDRTSLDESIILSVQLECSLCGLRSASRFLINGERSGQWPSTEPGHLHLLPKPRKHHYVFAHVVIPRLFFSNPDGFLASFPSNDWGIDRLRRLWTEVGKQMNDPDEEPIASDGLSISREMIGGSEAEVIQMPAVKGAVEVAYSVLLSSEKPRYLVLELTERQAAPTPLGVICEWHADNSRKNHERFCPIHLSDCVAAMNQLIVDERLAGCEGALGLPAWRPSGDFPNDLEFGRKGFRLELCRFAFEVIPKMCEEDPDALVQAVEEGRGVDYLIDQWRRSSLIGDISEDSARSITVEEIRVEGHRCVVVRMPRPISPPEPLFLAILLDRETTDVNKSYKFTAIYTHELCMTDSSYGWLLGRIEPDGMHAIITGVAEDSISSFICSIESPQVGRNQEHRINMMSQLMLYAQISSHRDNLTG
jgi:hypothetical protein